MTDRRCDLCRVTEDEMTQPILDPEVAEQLMRDAVRERSHTGPTDEQISAKWRTLGEGWHRLSHDCPTLYALLRQWACTAATLRDVADSYSKIQREAVDQLMSFSPNTATVCRALWPSWQTPSPNCLGSDMDDYHEALRFCGQVRGIYQVAFDMRLQAEALGLKVSL